VDLVRVIKDKFYHTRMHGIEYFLIDQFLPLLIVCSMVFKLSSSVWSKIQHYFRQTVVRGSEMHSVNSPTQIPSSSALNNESQLYNCSIICRGNPAERACPEATRWKILPVDYLAIG